jgi:hypothetical protein
MTSPGCAGLYIVVSNSNSISFLFFVVRRQ